MAETAKARNDVNVSSPPLFFVPLGYRELAAYMYMQTCKQKLAYIRLHSSNTIHSRDKQCEQCEKMIKPM